MSEKELPKLPEIDWDEFEIQYYINYWDGPLEGMGTYRGDRLWFNLGREDWIETGAVDEDGVKETKRSRKFIIYRPSYQQMLEHDYWHARFEEYVRKGDKVRELPKHKLFYEPYKEAQKSFEPFTDDQAIYIAVERRKD